MGGGKYGRRLIAECAEQGDKAQIEIRETIGGANSSAVVPIVFKIKDKKKKAAMAVVEWLIDNHICTWPDLIAWAIKFQIPEGKPLSGNGVEIEVKIKPKGEKNG